MTGQFDIPTTQSASSVSQVAHRIDGALRELGDGWVEGEVRSITRHRSGHVYLTLADEDSNLDACIWKGRVWRCEPLPAQGNLVQAHYERIDFHAPRGSTSSSSTSSSPPARANCCADAEKRCATSG